MKTIVAVLLVALAAARPEKRPTGGFSGFSDPLLPLASTQNRAFQSARTARTQAGVRSAYGAPTGAASAPEPNSQYGAPAGASSAPEPSSQYGAPAGAASAPQPNSQYGTPAGAASAPQPNSQYGAPAGAASAPQPNSQYGAPAGAASAPEPNSQYGAPTGAASGPEPNLAEPEEPASYNFEYAVKDEESGNDFGQQENREGDVTSGSYYVLLPDGRMQIVNYKVDGDSGYQVDIQYEGEANPEGAASGPQGNAVSPRQSYGYN